MSIFDIGVTGLRASQRALATAGHNIVNVNTEGYTRQRVELGSLKPQAFGNGFQGKGVEVTNVRRLVDQFLVNQVRVTATNNANVESFHEFASQIDRILGEADAGAASAMNGFFDSMQNVADSPASTPARAVLLAQAGEMTDRFNALAGHLENLDRAVNTRIKQVVSDVNDMAQAIAELNETIVLETGKAQGKAPNDLLDQRDQLLDQLSRMVGIETVMQEDGAVNVTIGNGQALVVGQTVMTLGAVQNPEDSSRLEVAYLLQGNEVVISDSLTKGDLGGMLRFRDEMLVPTRNDIGRLAATLAVSFNEQHQAGMDLTGALGTDFFSLTEPYSIADPANTGSITLSFDTANIGDLTADDYRLSYDGSNFTLQNLSTGATQNLGASGAGPFAVDGIVITETAGAAAGDAWLLQPTRYAASDVRVAIDDATRIAAAAPVKTQAATTNVSNARISAATVLDATDANLLNTTTITFEDPPTTYQVNGSGSFAYTSGADIDINGWRIQITGSPEAGDSFVVDSNTGGVGDNGNAIQLAGLQKELILDGGTATVGQSYEKIVGNVGAQTRQADLGSKATAALMKEAVDAKQEVGGVNLDEEAADLLRFQQHYRASAQIISAANAMFDALLSAVAR